MKKYILHSFSGASFAVMLLLVGNAANAQSYRSHVQPMIKVQCAECHGAEAPTLAEFKLNEEKYKKEKLGPRTDTYENLLQIVVYPDSGAFMRRVDDGTHTADKKPGNMYKHLGENERLAKINWTR